MNKPLSDRFNLSAWALQHRSLTAYLLAIMLCAGVVAYFQLGQNEDPEFTFRVMVLRTNWAGATARQVAEQVTDRLEKKLQETPYLYYLKSYSKPGESLIFIALQQSVPPKEVPGIWYQVRKKIGDIRGQLPIGVQGPFFNDEFGDTYGTLYAFKGDGFNYAELKRYVELARTELLRVPMVSKVDLIGVQEEKFFVEFSAEKLAQQKINLAQVVEQLQQQNTIQAAGIVSTGGTQIWMRISGQLSGLEMLQDLPLRLNGAIIRLGDFATVRRDYIDPPVYKMRHNNHEVIGLGITMAKDGNVITLGDKLQQAITQIQHDLPLGIEIAQVANQPAVVKTSINEFVHTLIEAIVIVLAVSFLSLGLHNNPFRIDIRPGLVVALTIPSVLALTFFGMRLLGIELQKISLGALIIALGLLVDDAIIAVEMMVRKLEEGYDKMAAGSFAYRSTAFPMLTGTLITAAGFLPIGLAKSAAGEYVFSMFVVIALSLLISWFAAVYFTPYFGWLLLKESTKITAHKPFSSSFYRRFRGLVNWCVTYRKTVIVLTLIALALGLAGFRWIPKQFFPDSSRPELMVDLWLAEGSRFQETERVAKKFESWIQKDSDILGYTTYVGGGSPRFYLPQDQQLNHINFAQIVLLTKDQATRERVVQKIRRAFQENFPEVRGRVNRLPNGPPVGYPVQFRVSGSDLLRLRTYAEEVKTILRKDPQLIEVNDDWNEQIKVLRLELEQDKARGLGVSSQQLAQAAQTTLSGSVIGQIQEQDQLIDIVLRQPLTREDAISRLLASHIPTNTGATIPITQVARLTPAFEEGIIWRYNRLPTITIRADVPDSVQGPEKTLQLKPKLAQFQKNLPPGYHLEIAGALEESKLAEDSININMPLMLIVIATLLMFQLQNLSRMFIVLLTGPLGIIGAALALLLFQAPFGFVAILGVIALMGMIIRNSVILVDQIEQNLHAGMAHWDALVEAAVQRCRPIILTAAAAILAMIPLTRSIFWGPMAIAIMGGLLVATALTLLYLPAAYAAWYRLSK